jgi:hypothetical protein
MHSHIHGFQRRSYTNQQNELCMSYTGHLEKLNLTSADLFWFVNDNPIVSFKQGTLNDDCGSLGVICIVISAGSTSKMVMHVFIHLTLTTEKNSAVIVMAIECQ